MKRKLLVSSIIMGLTVAAMPLASVYAQDSGDKAAQSQQTDKDKKEAAKLETVTVTGSLVKRPDYETTSPIQTVDIKADIAAGAFGTANLLQSTAIAGGSTQINNQFSGFVVGGGTGIQTINLRGLGSNRTLVLMDGQRPGPSGTQGQTGIGFDLNVVPEVILQSIEIVKDGSSSIYGSDAVAGVVNLITKKRMDHFEMQAATGQTQHGGGDQYTASLGNGWNFDNGNILVAAQFQEQMPLRVGDRDYLNCSNDLVWGTDGKRIDRADHSVTAGTPLSGCNNLYANSIIQYFNANNRYVPSVDGSTVGPFPGYHPRPYPTKNYANNPNGGAYYEDQLNFPFYGDRWAINKNRNSSFYASSLFTFGNNINWTNQFLYNHRQTNTQGWRQFFPIVYNPGDNDYYEPIMPFSSNNHETVNYYYFRTQLDGGFGSSSWSWQVNGTHSHSSGNYGHLGIDARVSGDLGNPANTLDLPPINYFEPCVLNGSCMNKLIDAVGLQTQGNTTYNQSTVNAVFTGNLFTLPAGDINSAFGAEYRRYSIDDQPDPNNAAGYEWGYSSAQPTKGSDHVHEIFGEVNIPILKGLPGVESLSADMSAREFKYASVGDSSNVWKYGLSWQITPTWRARGTMGTSYRAPQLYELYLGNQSGFLGQLGIDPCINWGDSSNDFIKANCAAAGIPSDYAANGNGSATIYQGGGKGFLTPEKSRAKSLGIVWTPTWGNFNMALDYFDYHIRGEISTLTAADIVNGCYGSAVYPNNFCNLFHRNSPSDPGHPNMITDVHATYININSERNRGYDLQMNYSDDFSFGKITADAEVTYTLEDTTQLFSSDAASGFTDSNRVGYIGSPKTYGLAHVALKRGDWTYSWQGTYVSTTRNRDLSNTFTYQGYPGAFRDITAKWQFLHSVSVGYDAGKWGVTFGIRNLFDKSPDLVSTGVDPNGRVGNTPIDASQYDWFGRTFFLRGNYNF